MNNTLGKILKFKFPQEYREGKIIVQQDHPSQAPYIAKWGAAGNPPTQQELDSWDQEVDADNAAKAQKAANRAVAKGRLKNPQATNSVPALRAMVDDILSYLELD